MADPVELPAARVDEAVYLEAAAALDDAEIDVLAGVVWQLVLEHPDLGAAEISAVIATTRDAIAASRPDPATDLSASTAVRIVRILGRLVPVLDMPVARDAARTYAQAFLRSHRRGTTQLRQIAPIDLQFDRFAEVDRFRRAVWQELHAIARTKPAVADAVDGSVIAEALGVRTGDDASTILAATDFGSLETFVADRLQPDGGILVAAEDVDLVLAEVNATVSSLRNQYATSLISLNRVEQKTRDQMDTVGGRERRRGDDEKSELEQAIENAEKKQKELDELLKGAAKGVKGTLNLAALAAAELGDDELAGDLREYGAITAKILTAIRDLAEAAISTAKVVEGLISAGSSTLFAVGAGAFSIALLAAMIQSTGLLSSGTKPVNQLILEELRAIREQLTDLRDEMRVRFDRIEKRLNKLYAGLLERLAEIDFDVGQIEGNVDELQLALYDLHAELQRLTRDVHSFLEAANRRDLVEAVNGSLNFEELTGQPLDFEGFLEAENVFFSWGRDHAKDVLQAGPDGRSFTDDDLVAELTSFPLATNVNYLRELPQERFNLPALSPTRLANPFDWIVAGEAYSQLSEESPAHAQQISPERVADLIAVGELLGESLARIADVGLVAELAAQYGSAFGDLLEAIAAVEAEFRSDPDTQVHGIDLWGGPEQEPDEHAFDDRFDELGRCDGRPFDDVHDTVPVPPSPGFAFDHSELLPYLIASNLRTSAVPGVAADLKRLRACVQATWVTVSVEDTGLGGRLRIQYRMSITVEVRYGDDQVFRHQFQTQERHQALVRQDDLDTFDPATDPVQGKEPHALLTGDEAQWAKLGTFPATHALVNPALRAATVALIERKLVLLQRGFYAEVARRFARDGDPVQRAGNRLTGSRLLWRAFVTAGFPLTLEANDILRSLLLGSDAILAGTDVDGEDSLLDDLQDIYTFFSARDEDPPATNIIVDIEELASERMDRLETLLHEVIDAGGDAEPPALFAPTLLRLSLIN